MHEGIGNPGSGYNIRRGVGLQCEMSDHHSLHVKEVQ
jgi:hypothetical protein